MNKNNEDPGLGRQILHQEKGALPTIPAGVTLDEGVTFDENLDEKVLRRKESRMQTAREKLLAREQWETDNIAGGTTSISTPSGGRANATRSRVRGALGTANNFNTGTTSTGSSSASSSFVPREASTSSSSLQLGGGAFGGAGRGLHDGEFLHGSEDSNGGNAPACVGRSGGLSGQGGNSGNDPNAGPRLVRAMNMRESTFLVGIKRQALRRLARRGGVRRVSYETYPIFRETLSDLLSEIVFDVNVMLDHTGRQTATARDVINVIARRGVKILGGEH
ncbi:unnamed protein product [Amoebophrya sp. A25]|nr:unnamed protein product [Amoebophrya sp. A25]|eukprot:GSA25T00009804001.1